MSFAHESNRRTEKAGIAGNVVTLRADRDRAVIADLDSDNPSTIDAAVSFILNVLFDSNRSKAEIRIARAMFRPSASIVLIPRDRPTLACAIGVDEFFTADKEMLRYEESWEESWRIHDPCTDPAARTRIRSHVLLDPNRDAHKPRTTEVVFAVRNNSNMQRFHSCTIVYDEAPRTSSPVTLFA
ncbi:MAG TPA: hypothetical protein VHE32_10475 [Rhodanobacteraceae bacterium]|nr:hypothetical protein [Rhodanobacteraceae bacterium]